jgi:hypothetical protein
MKMMKINNKRVSDEHHQKYMQLYKTVTGKKLGNSFSITKTVDEE